MQLDFVVVIPARGGSKRIPNKNIALLNGKPLMFYTLDAVRGLCTDIIVSTDNAAIAGVAKAGGARLVDRPAQLATDTASTESALLHVLEVLENEGRTPMWIMTLPTTSPLRGTGTIRRAISLAAEAEDDVDCIFTITENRGAFWVEQRGEYSPLFQDAPRRQQDRMPLWEENSALYITRVKALRETGFILGRKARGLAISAQEGLDINTPVDLKMAEVFLREVNHG